MSSILQQIKLSDGTVANVDQRTAKIVSALQGLERELAAGLVGCVFIGRVTKASYEPSPLESETLLGFFEHEGLPALSSELFKEGRRAQEVASLWDGNAPTVSRSVRNQ